MSIQATRDLEEKITALEEKIMALEEKIHGLLDKIEVLENKAANHTHIYGRHGYETGKSLMPGENARFW